MKKFGGPLAAMVLIVAAWSTTAVANSLQARMELRPASRAERDAGVWLDGQYLGHLRDVGRRGGLTVLPGERHLLIRLAGYQDLSTTVLVEPGQRHQYRVSMPPDPAASYPEADEVAELRLSVRPGNAAVFVNEVYAGHVDRFSGRNGLRVRAGTHRVKITLPGYQPFETEVTLRATQRYEIKTELPKGSITEQSPQLRVSR